MADFEPRLINFRVLGMIILIASLVFLAIALVGLFQAGIPEDFWAIAFPIALIGAFLGFTFYGLTRVLLAVEANTFHLEETLTRLLRHLDGIADGVNALNENILLSEDAKSIAFRKKDLQALRQAIDEEINLKNYEAGLYLVDQMEKRFGYRQEAAQYRQKIQQINEQARRVELDLALARFDDAINALDWEAAGKEIDRVEKDFSDFPEARQLPERLEQAWTERKRVLLRQWDQAVQRNEIDRGIEVLKELDRYLTSSEVAAFEESARGVFRAKLHNLGVRFSLLVTEKAWDKALDVGREIVEEFPNSQMAQEIRERLSTLEAKAQAVKQQNQKEK